MMTCSFLAGGDMMILFTLFFSTSPLSDLYEYRVSTNEWRALHNTTETLQAYGIFKGEVIYPGSRYLHQIGCFISQRPETFGFREIILYGGSGYYSETSGLINLYDYWIYTIETSQWEFINDTNFNHVRIEGLKGTWGTSYPGTRFEYTSISINELSYWIMFSGYSDGNGFTNDIYIFNVTSREIKWEFGTDSSSMCNLFINRNQYNFSNVIGHRSSSVGWKISQEQFYVYGGFGFAVPLVSLLADLWMYNLRLGMWKFVSGYETMEPLSSYVIDYGQLGVTMGLKDLYPAWKSSVASFYLNENGGEIYFFGGVNGDLNTNELVLYSIKNDEWTFVYGKPFKGVFSIYTSDFSSSNAVGSRGGSYMKPYYDSNGQFNVLLIGGFGFSDNTYDRYLGDAFLLKRSYICHEIFQYEPNVCGAHGKCIGFEKCNCDEGWFGHDCIVSKCGNIFSNDSRVCNSKGFCADFMCKCIPNFVGNECEIPLCSNTRSDDEKVCSSRGECKNDNQCHCIYGFEGINCEQRNLFLSSTIDVWYVYVILTLLCTVIISICIFVLFITILIISKQRKTLKKIEEIGDIDLILEEKRLEEDLSIAHLRINKKLFEINEKDLKYNKSIGRGGSNSNIIECEWKGQIVALKLFKRSNVLTKNQESFEEFEKELEILASISHPNILSFYGALLSEKRIGIVMEKGMDEVGVFVTRFHKNNGFKYPMAEKIRLLREIANGMMYLHSHKIIHRDLKPANVLVVGKSITAKVCDFGISKIMKDDNKVNTKRIGTSYYMAPEVFQGTKYDIKCDVFSYGILIHSLITETHQPYGRGISNVELKVCKDPNYRPSIEMEGFNITPKWIIELMQNCWKHVAYERPNFIDVIKVIKKNICNIVNDDEIILEHENISNKNDIIIKLRNQIRLLKEELTKQK